MQLATRAQRKHSGNTYTTGAALWPTVLVGFTFRRGLTFKILRQEVSIAYQLGTFNLESAFSQFKAGYRVYRFKIPTALPVDCRLADAGTTPPN